MDFVGIFYLRRLFLVLFRILSRLMENLSIYDEFVEYEEELFFKFKLVIFFRGRMFVDLEYMYVNIM